MELKADVLNDNKKASLEEVRRILLNRGLLEKDEEVIWEMMEDLVHFAYFTGCITKADVKRLLGLTAEQAKAKIQSWKVGDEGNRSCSLIRNPFTEEWRLKRKKKG